MKLSLRFQVIGLGTAVLLAGMLTYMYFATAVVTRDKLAYVYDVNAALVAAKSEELRSNLNSLADKLLLVAEQHAADDQGRDLEPIVRALVRRDSDILSLEIWRRGPEEYTRAYRFINQEALDEIGLPLRIVAGLREAEPLPFATVEAAGIALQNNSIPPDLAILTLAVADVF
jgi:hypothetical protein